MSYEPCQAHYRIGNKSIKKENRCYGKIKDIKLCPKKYIIKRNKNGTCSGFYFSE